MEFNTKLIGCHEIKEFSKAEKKTVGKYRTNNFEYQVYTHFCVEMHAYQLKCLIRKKCPRTNVKNTEITIQRKNQNPNSEYILLSKLSKESI